MRDQETIEHELTAARGNLEHDLGELKDVVRDKLDVKQRMRDAVQRGKHQLGDLSRRARSGAREHPGTALALLAGLALLVSAVVFTRSRRPARIGRGEGGARALTGEIAGWLLCVPVERSSGRRGHSSRALASR